MKFYQRAFQYVKCKKSKSILLFLCFLVLDISILCASMILQTAQETSASIQEKTGAKLVLECKGKYTIPIVLADRIAELPNVTEVNRSALYTAYLPGLMPVTDSASTDPINRSVTLCGYDRTDMDSPFAEGKYRLLEGTTITQENSGVIIHSFLAQANGLKLGDTITFEAVNGKQVSGQIVGICYSGMERKQEGEILAAHRIENQIFISNGILSKLCESEAFLSLSVYTDNPAHLDELQKQVEPLVDDTVRISSSDSLYRQMQASLKQVTGITTLMLGIVLVTAVIVISLMLCIWMRTRAKEIAVLISLGTSKANILLQNITESFFVFFLSAIGSIIISSLISNQLMEYLFTSVSISAHVQLQWKNVLALFLLGGCLIFCVVTFSDLPVLRASVRDTLSRMEE